MQPLLQWFFTDIVPAFSRTLLHSLWQAVAAAILAGGLIALTRRRPAAVRYNGLAAIYGLLLLTAAGTFFYELGAAPPAATHSITSITPLPTVTAFQTEPAVTPSGNEDFGTAVLHFIDNHAAQVAALWALLFLIQLTRTAFGLRYVRLLRVQGTQPLAAEWTEWLQKAGMRLGIRRPVLLLQSERLQVPVALGFLKPVVMVPLGLLNNLTPDQVEAVLLHELAHIRRSDYIVNLIQSFADAVFAFNPAVRWLSARIRDERESCCDSIVVSNTGNKKSYVEALVSFSRLPLSPSYAMAIGSSKHHLLNRVKTIITRENSRLTGREQATLLAGLILMVAFGAVAFKPKENEVKKNTFIQKQHPATAKNNTVGYGTGNDKTAPTPLLLKPVVDTIPTAKNGTVVIKWRSLSTNTVDNGDGKTTQVTGTAEDGTIYRVRKVGGEVVLLSVNNEEIPKENYLKYRPMIEAIEQAGKKSEADALRSRDLAMQKKDEAMQRKDEAMQRKDEAMQLHQEVLQKKAMAPDKKRDSYRKDSMAKAELLKTYTQQEREYNQREKEYAQKEQAYNQSEKDYYRKEKEYREKEEAYHKKEGTYKPYTAVRHSNSTVTAIIYDLLANNLADNETRLSFTLTGSQLIVNGKTADKGVFEVFRKKYIKSDGDSYDYSKDGGNTKTSITTNK